MSIQSSINQTLSIAGALAAMNPELQALGKSRAELRELKKAGKNIVARDEIILNKLRYGTDEEAEFAAKVSESYEGEALDVSKKLFSAVPTEEQYQKLVSNIKSIEERKAFREKESATESARNAILSSQEDIRNTRTNFTDYMKAPAAVERKENK